MANSDPTLAHERFGADSTMPSLFRAADQASAHGQNEYLRLIGISLASLVIAAAAGLLTFDPFNAPATFPGVVSAVGFVVALVLRTYMLTARPERLWYDGRAVAESAKTLAWRYAVGGLPFPADSNDADRIFSQRIREVITGVQDLLLEPDEGDEITPEMRSVRSLPLEQRKRLYEHLRVDDQRQWYASRARRHGQRGRRLSYITLLLECVGACLAVLKVAGTLQIDFVPLVASFSAALIGWERARQDATVARAYAIAGHELNAIHAMVATPDTEAAWAEFVANAEEAISREHTMWQASRVS